MTSSTDTHPMRVTVHGGPTSLIEDSRTHFTEGRDELAAAFEAAGLAHRLHAK